MKTKRLIIGISLFFTMIFSSSVKAQYCSANAAGTCYHYLGQVVFGSINQTTACVDYTSFYRDWTSASTNITQGNSLNITLYNTSIYGCYFRVWIDWNQDFDFFDAGENVVVAGPVGGLSNYTTSITCPAGAATGPTRMRVKADYYNNFGGGPCASSNETETQDYTVNVVALAPGTISGIVNSYAAVTGICSSEFTVSSTTGFSVGDRVMVIQMRGATMDITNTSGFGNITALNVCGQYEFFTIGNISGSIIATTALPQTAFNVAGQVQMIKVAYYTFPVTTATNVSCPAWNGSTGGVIVIETPNTLTLNGTIDASGRGFRGGAPDNAAWGCNNAASYGYSYVATSTFSAPRGEGIGSQLIGAGNLEGRGNAANGGGAGNNVNAGGGGGSNIGAGGIGGFQWVSCADPMPAQTQGIPGYSMSAYYSNVLNRIYVGGGGGGGHAGANVSGGGAGANGGGIIILRASVIDGGGSILSTGNSGINVSGQWAGGGGGAGGTVLISCPSVSGSITVNTSGGDGGPAYWPNQVGPGGGGGGGLLWVSSGSVPAAISYTSNGGTNGLWTNGAAAWGAASGNAGGSLTGLVLPSISTTPAILCTILPVEWVDINATCTEEKNIKIEWKTVSQEPVSGYTIKRSVNGSDFEPIGNVSAVSLPGMVVSYTFEDTDSPSQHVYYQVSETNTNGNSSVSPIVSMFAGSCRVREMNLFPNPAQSYVDVNLNGKKFESGTVLNIFNVAGQQVHTLRIPDSVTQIRISTETLPAGVYRLQCMEMAAGFVITR